MSQPDGGPAFPFLVACKRGDHPLDCHCGAGSFPGMTLRDWFAGMALQGLLAASEEQYGGSDAGWVDDVSEDAYRIADAMLRQREVK